MATGTKSVPHTVRHQLRTSYFLLSQYSIQELVTIKFLTEKKKFINKLHFIKKSVNTDQADTPTHVVTLLQEHLHVNASVHIQQPSDHHAHHKLQNVHICGTDRAQINFQILIWNRDRKRNYHLLSRTKRHCTSWAIIVCIVMGCSLELDTYND